MSDPKRWLDEGGGGTADERELLELGRNARMPSALRKRVWLGIAAGVGGIGASAGAAAGGAAAGGAAAGGSIAPGAAAKGTLSLLFSGAAAKTVLAVAVLGGTGIGVAALKSSSGPAVTASGVRAASADTAATQAIEVPSTETRGAIEPVAPSDPPVAARTPDPNGGVSEHKLRTAGTARSGSRSAPSAAAQAEDVAPPRTEPALRAEPAPETHVASRLREESAAVVAARKTLLSGDSAEALRMLDRLRTDFPNGALVQEREALMVRALVESGQKEAARKRGEAFLRAFPRSPHAAEVRALLGP